MIRGGGADGSLLTFNATELTFEANDGLDDVTAGNQGEVMSAINGTLRLQSDSEVSSLGIQYKKLQLGPCGTIVQWRLQDVPIL